MVSDVMDLILNGTQTIVLILVLMEYGLGQVNLRKLKEGSQKVLILVLMEYGLGRWKIKNYC